MYSKLDAFNHINVNLDFFFEFTLNKHENWKTWNILLMKMKNKKKFFEIA
jgi:hypothetical protein